MVQPIGPIDASDVGVALGKDVSAVVAGGVALLVGASIIAWTASHSAGAGAAVLGWIPLAAYVAVSSAIGVATTFLTPETSGRDLDAMNDA